MVAAVDVRATQGTVINLATGKPSLRLTQAGLLAVFQHATAALRSTQAAGVVVVGGKPALRTTQAAVLVLWAGRTENRKLRAWAFSQDGHDFYVLRLGESMTLVHDLTTGQWSRWSTPSLNVWRAQLGLNWTGQGKTTLDLGYAWNVVGGDDTLGILWIADPTQPRDHNTSAVETEFTRQLVGALPMRGRETAQCGAVYLLGNLGNPTLVGDTVTLETSDDQGFNWLSHGAVTITAGDVTQEIGWLGLGLISAPGRLFRITDTGAFARVSSLDMRA